MPSTRPSATYDGVPAAELAGRVGVPALHVYAQAPSTMDLAHAAAASGAAAGTTVVADLQTAGRGRNGRRWLSGAPTGVWATVVERPTDLNAVPVLSLRVGLALAAALEPLRDDAGAAPPVALKWPNDLLLGGRKLAGILVEARWREGTPEWVAVGVGVNCTPPPDMPDAAALGARARRATVLAAVVASVRAAAAARGALTLGELEQYAARDAVRGRTVAAPVAGVAAGVDATGALLVRIPSGAVRAVPTASVRYATSRDGDSPSNL